MGKDTATNLDFLKNLKLENKSKAYVAGKGSMVGGEKAQDYAEHLLEHQEQWQQKKAVQI